MLYSPLMIDFTDKKIVVIGGGKVASRKVKSYIDSAAEIKIVSPTVTAEIASYFIEGKVNWKKRYFKSADVVDAFFVIAATNNTALNQTIIQECHVNQLTLNVSAASAGNTITPANITRGNIQVAVSTNGMSPIVAKRIRDKIAVLLDEFGDETLESLSENNQFIKQRKLQKLADSVER